MKKTLAILLALVMIMSLATAVSAQTIGTTSDDTGTITVKNASKGVTYTVVKIFDATVSSTGSIVYTGTVPDALGDYFKADTNGYISAKEETLSDAAISALKSYAESQTATASAVSDGSELEFVGLPYGYYVVTTTQGTAISVDSTTPKATVYDKNSTTPSAKKEVDDAEVAIGDTVTYTLTFNTSNYLGEGESAKQVVKYVISDTLPEFLSDVKVTSITIGDEEYKVDNDVPQFVDNAIIIPWVSEGNSLYNNGADIVITYTAKVTSSVTVDGEGNKNDVTLTPYTDEDTPWSETWSEKVVIKTAAAAVKKVDETGAALAGATFKIVGLTVNGSNGSYTVVSYDASATDGTVMECDDNGNLVIVGLDPDVTYSLTEVKAPDGYNLLTAAQEVKPVLTNSAVTVTTNTVYYDEDGNVTDTETETYTTTVSSSNDGITTITVTNEKGTELPSTGGIGTTLFYIIGGILVVAAAVVLVTKKRMSAEA